MTSMLRMVIATAHMSWNSLRARWYSKQLCVLGVLPLQRTYEMVLVSAVRGEETGLMFMSGIFYF